MTKRTMVILAVLALLAASVPAAFAAPDGGLAPGCGRQDRDGSGTGRGPCVALDLTDEQVQAMTELREQFMAETATLREQLRHVRDEYRVLRRTAGVDPAEIEAKYRELEQIRGALQSLRDEHQAEVRSLLTPEQAARFDEWEGGCGRSDAGLGGSGRGAGQGMGGRGGFGAGQGRGGCGGNGQGVGQGG